MVNKPDLNAPEYHNFRIFGIGTPTAKQIERKENRVEKRTIRKGEVASNETMESANLTDAYITSQLGDDETKTNYIPYIAIGGGLILTIALILILKPKKDGK